MNKFFLLFIIIFLQGCIALGGKKLEVKILDTSATKTAETTSTTPVNKTNDAIVSSVNIVNHQLVIKGTGFDEISSIKVKGNSFNENFSIESLSSTQIIANGVRAVSMGVGSVFDLVLDSAYGTATFQINFSLCDATLGTKGFDCTAVPNDKDVLSYDANTHKWKPRAISGLNYQGAWDATTSLPATTGVGDYFIVSVANAPYNIGDWIVFNGSGYDRVSNGSAITNVFGRTGAVAATKGDYVLTKMGDVDLTTTPPTTGQYLKYNGTNWVPATVAAETDPTVKVFAQTNLPTCTAGQVLKSDGTAFSCVTDNTGAAAFSGTSNRVVATNGSGALTVTAISDTILGYLSGVTSSVQAQLDAKLNSSTFVDWSASGVQLIDPSHLTLAAGNASKAVVTSGTGAIVASSVTATELGYVSGVTSAIQTQLTAKQDALSTGPTINGIVYPATAAATLQVPLAPVALTDAVNKQYVDSFGQWIISGSDAYRSTGKVAIGTATPTAGTKLDITGTGAAASSIIIPRDTVANRPTTGVNGMLRYASDTNKFEAYENGAWTNIISTSAAPTGTAGGDLGGTYPNPTITGLAATKIASGTVSNTVFGYLANVTSDIQTQITAKLSSTLADTKMFVGNGSSVATAVSMSGDATIANTGAVTLKNTGTAGTYSSVTTDAQGRVTAGTNPVVVTSITGTAPVTVAGTAAVPVVSMAAATTSVNGYLTSTNWNTFNGKQDALSTGPTINGIVYPATSAATLQIPLAPVSATDAVNKQYVDSYGHWTISGSDIYRASGNVGIGTATPAGVLDVLGTTATTFTRNFPAASGPISATQFGLSGNSVVAGTGPSMLFFADNSTPAKSYIGRVSAVWENGTSGAEAGALTFGVRANAADSNATTERMRISSAGNVGIGTTPSYLLDLNLGNANSVRLLSGSGSSNGFLSAPFSNFVFGNNVYYDGSNWRLEKAAYGAFVQTESTTGNIHLVTASSGAAGSIASYTQRLTVLNNGNIGVSNTAPTAKLTVTPSSSSSGAITLTAASAATTFTTSTSTTLNVGDYLIPTTSTGQARSVTVGGTGTSFTVSPAFSGNVNAETYTIYPAAMNVNSGSLMVQGSTGNVGIGTNSPTGSLHVVGGTAAAATNGTHITLAAQNAGSGNQNGGNIVLTPGAYTGTGQPGGVGINASPNGSYILSVFTNGGPAGNQHYVGYEYNNTNNADMQFNIVKAKSGGVTSSDALGTINFIGRDAAGSGNTGAQIRSLVDGTPATGQTPGNLLFLTTLNGSGSLVERMRITNAGNIGIGINAPTTGTRLDITGTGATASSIIIPRDTVANRPTTGVNGMLRYASDTNKFEAYENGAWVNLVGTGTVTSVTGTAPVTVGGTASVPAISMAAATTSVNGYLTSTDWTTFNGKQAALSTGPTINGVVYPASSAVTMQFPLDPINLTDAANKQYVDNNGVWTAASGNAYRLTGNVGIGTNSPSNKLQVMQSTDTSGIRVYGSTVPTSYFDLFINNLGNPRFYTPQIMVFQGDSGMYFRTGSNSVNFQDSGTGPITMGLGGANVGIGVSPSAKLHVSGSLTTSAWTTNGIGLRTDAATYTDNSSSGTVATNYVNVFGAPTLAASSATTYTTAATLYVNAPVAGTNVTVGSNMAILTNGLIQSIGFYANGNIRATNNTAVFSLGGSNDVILSRQAAANLQLGAADAAAPVAQTLSAQSVVAGTSNTAGTNFTINGSRGTGTGAGGSILFQTAPAGTTGTAQNALATAMSILSSGNVGIGIAAPSYPLDVQGTGQVFRSTQNGGSGQQVFSLARINHATQNNEWSYYITNGGGTLANGSLEIYPTTTADLSIDARNAQTNQLVLKASGFIGMGNASPSYKLDVNGDINSVGSVRASGVALTSDRRWKRNITPLKDAAQKIKQINGVSYDWAIADYPEKNFSDRKQIGVIAQDVQAVFPELVIADKQGFLSVNYPALIAPLIEAFKAQQKDIEANVLMFKTMQGEIYQIKQDVAENKREIASLKAENAQMKLRLERLEKLLLQKIK